MKSNFIGCVVARICICIWEAVKLQLVLPGTQLVHVHVPNQLHSTVDQIMRTSVSNGSNGEQFRLRLCIRLPSFQRRRACSLRLLCARVLCFVSMNLKRHRSLLPAVFYANLKGNSLKKMLLLHQKGPVGEKNIRDQRISVIRPDARVWMWSHTFLIHSTHIRKQRQLIANIAATINNVSSVGVTRSSEFIFTTE